MAILKILFLLTGAYCTSICLTPPNPPAKSTERRRFTTKFTLGLKDVLPIITVFYKYLTLGVNIVEVIVILASALSTLRPDLSSLALRHSTVGEGIGITPTYLVGFAILVGGTILRVSCYRALGELFTFELTLRPNHKLITSGPYSFARHPSYTAGFLFMNGLLISQLGPGSWWHTSGLWSMVFGRLFLAAWLGTVTVVEGMLIWRTGLEDEVLRREFGQEWDEWADRTRYRLVPGLY
ncbi:hypothetical protein BXZ70DRAFT_653279 [Cristinia sonorae]|uniref:Protein-S-isoprenylcysteine O-methyltransferase n=1 Tax=Cristinia sonorae TaxID=1940300 RepID=A0A8K0UF41_9AGAR|nr:hypothetical protein BXZ70DRAFT_653279 [Cristinia sonorae]